MIKTFDNNGAILIAVIASSENDYWICDARYTIAWFFDSTGKVTDEKPIILDSADDSITEAVFQIINNNEILVASKIAYNKISVKHFTKSSNKWTVQNDQIIKYRKWLNIICFLNTSNEIRLIGITGNRIHSRSITL